MKYFVCNLKNKMGLKDFLKYNEDLKSIDTKHNKLIVACSSIYLAIANGPYELASQDITSLIDEIVTGEITGHQLSLCGVKYVLVGHSERRTFKKEINIDFINKINEAQNNGLKIIYCIGETFKEKEEGKTLEVLTKELQEVLNNVALKDIIIAYEPVWAIGSGKLPSMAEIEDNIAFIKDYLFQEYETDFKVLYGGSINHDNIEELNNIPELDGFLVGGASLESENVQKMLDIIDENN